LPYRVVDAEDVEPSYGGVFRALRSALGVQAFGINQIDLEPGTEGREHDHAESGQEEVYVVLGGSGIMIVDGEEVELRPGRYLFVAPESRRKPVAGAAGLSWVVAGAPVQEGWRPDF
jgi:uncharacterized cupin superfamily protein